MAETWLTQFRLAVNSLKNVVIDQFGSDQKYAFQLRSLCHLSQYIETEPEVSFDLVEIYEEMKRNKACHVKPFNDFDYAGIKDWLNWKGLYRYSAQREEQIAQAALAEGLEYYAFPKKISTSGGPGNRVRLCLELKKITGDVGNREKTAVDENLIRYRRERLCGNDAAFPFSILFKKEVGEVEVNSFVYQMYLNAILLVFVVFALVAILFQVSAYMSGSGFSLKAFAVFFFVGVFLLPFFRCFEIAKRDRLYMPWQPFFFKRIFQGPGFVEYVNVAEGVGKYSLVQYRSVCPICQSEVWLDSGRKQFPGRYVGRCSDSPLEHVFSFDRVGFEGRLLLGSKSI